MLHDCDQAVSDYGTVYLDADSILRCAPEPLDLEMLFEPFEEQLDAPPVFIEQRDGQRIRLKIVREEDVHLVRFRVNIDDFPYLFGTLVSTKKS